MPAKVPFSRWMAAIPVMLLAAACGGGGDANTDTAAGTTAATATASDTGMAGMDHSRMAMNRSAPRDSNQSFLRMMSDHHQGLLALADTARPKLGATAKADAEKMATKQKSEQDHMLQMLRADYQDSITPMIMPSNRAMVQAVADAGAGDADRVFYQQVIAHHREGIQMADKMLPHLTGMSKQMAEKARTDQQREIAELEKKMGGTR